jgi:DHA2 family multidrug resistance protein-like MFS transporter
MSAAGTSTTQPTRITLIALIMGALVANINLGIANIALPDIGRSLGSSQTQLNLVAVGCTLGLAMSVLYLGALGDRFGRKMMLMLGMILTVPASMLCAWAPNTEILIAGRVFTGIAAGMAYPTTLALITALWAAGPGRVKAIALWSGVSGGGAILGPTLAGLMLEYFWWGSVFLIAVPLAAITLLLVMKDVPAHVNESTNPVDHLGGVLSVAMIALLVLGLGIIASPGALVTALLMLGASVGLIVLFLMHEKRARYPLYNLTYARRRLFWLPALGGMIGFGTLMGSMFIGQQFLQNVLQYSTFTAGLAVIPAALGMMLVAPISAKVVISMGSRDTMLMGYAAILPAFLLMLIAWQIETPYWQVGLAYLLVGLGAGMVLTPASRSLTSSVPVSEVGMASGTTDLQRDLGGSIMQALLGSLLTAGFAASMVKQIGASPEASEVTQSIQSALTLSFTSAESVGAQYPQYASAITAAARESFLSGANWAYAAAALTIVIGAVLVALRFPGKQAELALLGEYAKADATTSE